MMESWLWLESASSRQLLQSKTSTLFSDGSGYAIKMAAGVTKSEEGMHSA